MKKTKFSEVNDFQACENYVVLPNDGEAKTYCEMAQELQISILVLDNTTISHRNKIQNSINNTNLDILSPSSILEDLKEDCYDLNQFIKGFKNVLASNDGKRTMLISRITLREKTIDKLKKALSSSRKNFEVICLESTDLNLLKWASHDRRVDYLSLDIKGSNPIDNALCSLMKQNNKPFEIVVSSLLNSKNEKEFGTALRNGKKIMEKISSNNNSFILTIKPNSPYQLRTSNLLRYLGELIGFPFRKTKDQIFQNQLETIVRNTLKLDDSNLFEGIREVK